MLLLSRLPVKSLQGERGLLQGPLAAVGCRDACSATPPSPSKSSDNRNQQVSNWVSSRALCEGIFHPALGTAPAKLSILFLGDLE